MAEGAVRAMTLTGYLGSVDLEEDEDIFQGKLEFIRALVSYEAGDTEGLVQAFRDAVDDYLSHSEEQDAVPAVH